MYSSRFCYEYVNWLTHEYFDVLPIVFVTSDDSFEFFYYSTDEFHSRSSFRVNDERRTVIDDTSIDYCINPLKEFREKKFFDQNFEFNRLDPRSVNTLRFTNKLISNKSQFKDWFRHARDVNRRAHNTMTPKSDNDQCGL